MAYNKVQKKYNLYCYFIEKLKLDNVFNTFVHLNFI